METIVVLGAGKIGRMVAHFLGRTGDYRLRIGDSARSAVEHVARDLPTAEGSVVDFGSAADLDRILAGATAVISCAPYHCNLLIAARAKAAKVHYLDLTEDVAVTRGVADLAEDAETAFVPQCGLAPGFITICAVHLLEGLTDVRDVRMRVGALPRYPSNMLRYNLTWSTEGLINEYCRPCEVVRNGELVEVQPLENLETLVVDGVEYEAFNTSGGLGTLATTLQGSVRNVDYKSIRYPGHAYLMKFLLRDLQMEERQDVLREILERSLPITFQDQIVVFVSATGRYRGKLTERTWARTIRHREIDGENWSGIQITTASGVCAVLELLLAGRIPGRGFVRQEDVAWQDFITNRFGRHYDPPA